MAKSKFTDMTIDYRQLLKMTVSDRVSLIGSTMGQGIMQSLTATQYASLFPTYYKERGTLPDYSGFQKAMTPEGAKRIASAPTIAPGTRSAAGGTAAATALAKSVPMAVQRMEKQTGIKVSDPGAKAQLSSEKKEIFDLLKQGKISADDPRAAFLKELSKDDLKRAGIDTVDEGEGKQSFKMSDTKASQLSKEELAEISKRGGVQAGTADLASGQAIKKQVYDSFRNAGMSDNQARAMTAEVGRENAFNPKIMFGEHQDLNKKTNIGMLSHQGSRRTEFLNFMKDSGMIDENGKIKQSQESMDAMARFYKKEIETNPAYAKTKEQFLGNPDISREDAAAVLGDNYIRWARHGNMKIGFSPQDAARHAAGRDAYYNEITDINKKFPGALPSNASPEQVEEMRKKIEEAELRGREQTLAELTIGKPPEGLSERLLEYYKTLNPGQKQRFNESLEKLGEGVSASGVAKLNESFNSDPKATQESIEREVRPGGNVRFSDSGVESRASGLADATKTAYEKLKVFGPPNSVVTSTFRGTEHPIEAAKIRKGLAPGAHSRGEAVDVQTRDKSPAELAAMIQALKKSGFNNVLLEGDPPHIHAEVRPGQTGFTVSNLGQGNPGISLEAAQAAAAAAEYNIALNEEQEKKKQETMAAEQAAAAARPIQQRGMMSYAGIPTATPNAEQPPAPAANQQTASLEQSTEAPPVQAFADGGEAVVNDGEISAQPISAIKGDNSLVVDGNKNPLFTMNTKEESANFDPKTGKVSVEPVSKNNPDALKSSESPAATIPEAPTQAERSQENNNNISSINSSKASEPNHSMEAATRYTENPIHCPSFGRALAAANFKKSGDHFDGGATNVK